MNDRHRHDVGGCTPASADALAHLLPTTDDDLSAQVPEHDRPQARISARPAPGRMKRIHATGSPAWSDSPAWLEFARSCQLASVPPGAIVEALRAQVRIGHARAANALVGHISLIITRRLRAMIGTNHPDRGEPMIERAHGDLMVGLFDPDHGDYTGLSAAFGARVACRAVDAIRAERRYNARHLSYDAMPGGIDAAQAAQTDGATGSIDVEHVLSIIPDVRKRLAFRLYMDGAQVGAGPYNIAEAIGIDPRTAARWIVEVRSVLADAIGRWVKV